MANIFICHASEDKATAKRISHALTNANHEVFFDEKNLSASEDYHPTISKAIKECSIFIFLITKNSLRPGKYTLTELKLIEKRWHKPAGKVLPVNLDGTLPSEFPPYISTIVGLTVCGDAAAEVRAEVDRLRKGSVFSSLWERVKSRHRTHIIIFASTLMLSAGITLLWHEILKNNAETHYMNKQFDLAHKEFESTLETFPLIQQLSTRENTELSAALSATKFIEEGFRICQDYLKAKPGEQREKLEKNIAELWDNANKMYPYGVSHDLECKR